jgi:hypothetical protein
MNESHSRIEGIVARLRARFKSIRIEADGFADDRLLSELEAGIQQALNEAGNEFMQEVVQEQASRRDVETVICDCGARMSVKDWRPKSIYTRHGSISMRRRYLICKKCSATRRPLDDALRVPGRFSPDVVELIALVGVTESSRRASEKLAKLAGLQISHKTILEHSTHLGKDLQQQQTRQAPASPLPPEALQACVSMDGVMVNTQTGWREMKLGCIYDYGLAWRQYVASLEDAHGFGRRLRKVAGLSGAHKAPQLVAIADGATWIWQQIETQLPFVDVQIVDFYHAAQQLATAARTFYGEGTPQAKRWLQKHRHILRHSGARNLIKKLCNSRRYRKKDKEMHRLVGYFKRHRKRMDYPRFTQLGYDIGSGLIESSCKNVVQMRLKGPGMRWREGSACAIATLRAALLSEHWDEFFARRLVA